MFAGGAAALGCAALLLADRFTGALRDTESSGSVVGVAQTVMGLYALVLAFTVVTLDTNYEDAGTNVRDEANSLDRIVGYANVLPRGDRQVITAAVAAYIKEVRAEEFPAMRKGKVGVRGGAETERVFGAVQQVRPTTFTEQSFVSEATPALADFLSNRRDRLAAADSVLPSAFWVLMIITGVLSIGVMALTRTHAAALDLILVGAVAGIVGIGWLTTLLLEHPFSGSIAVSSTPYVQGTLAHLPGIAP